MPNSEPGKRYSGVLMAADSLSGTITLQVSAEMFAAGSVVTGGVYVVLRDRDIKALKLKVWPWKSAVEQKVGLINARKRKIAEQVKTIERLKNMAVGLATSWAQAWEQTSPTDTAWKDAYDQALRDRHVIVTSGIDDALKEARDHAE